MTILQIPIASAMAWLRPLHSPEQALKRRGRRGCAGAGSALGLSGVVELHDRRARNCQRRAHRSSETQIQGLALPAMVLIAAIATLTWRREYGDLPPGVALAALTGIELALVLVD